MLSGILAKMMDVLRFNNMKEILMLSELNLGVCSSSKYIRARIR